MVEPSMKKKAIALCALLLVTVLCAAEAQARVITDMTGRKVTVPDTIRRVFTGSPPATLMLYALDPALLVGGNFNVTEEEKRFLRPEFTRLTVVGGIFGQGKSVNMELLLGLKPDVVIMWSTQGQSAEELFVKRLQNSGIPTVFVSLDRIESYPEAFLFLGDLLDRKERAHKLADYARKTLSSVSTAVANIPERERVSVYYAEGPDGLSTEREKSWHTQLIPLAGGNNVHKGNAMDNYGMEKVSMEQVLLYDPDVVLTHDRTFYASLANDRRWHGMRAYKEKRCYLIPRMPFNWFDRPPSFMRLIGLKWLTNLLYPKRYPLDIRVETQKFYRLFLGVELSERDIHEVLYQ